MKKTTRWLLIGAFTIALLGLLWQAITLSSTPDRLLAMALLLLGIDQTRMAIVDLTNIAAVRAKVDADHPHLHWFERITRMTIGLELLGFYLSSSNFSVHWLGGGGGIVLLSQIWFNLLARFQLCPDHSEPIQAFGIRDRAIVLLADVVGLLLIGLHISGFFPLVSSTLLLLMVTLYLIIKYNSQPLPPPTQTSSSGE